MINGIIINTFTAMRQDIETKLNDMNNNCFMCNLDRSVFQKKGIEFTDHINNHHYIKDYLIYFIIIRLKNEIDLDPDESRILNQIKNNDVSFFPSFKCLDWDWSIVE